MLSKKQQSKQIEINQDIFINHIREAQDYDMKMINKKICNVTVNDMDFKSFTFEHCIFENCIFEHCNFGASFFITTDINHSQFLNCDFSETLFDRVDFTQTKLIGSRFIQSVLKKTMFKHSKLDYANFCECRFRTVNFKVVEAQYTDFSQIDHKKFKTDHSNFTRASFYQTKLAGVDLSESIIEGIIISDTLEELKDVIVSREQAMDLSRSLLKLHIAEEEA